MKLIHLQIYFILSSFLLFVFVLSNKRRAPFAFGYALALNIFPLSFMSYFSMDIARLASIPLAYIPMMVAGFSLFFVTKLRIRKEYERLLLFCFLFLLYSFITTMFLGGFTFRNFAYWFAWGVNFLIFWAAVSFFSSLDIKISHRVIKYTVIILVIGCIIGILRYVSGISLDANFMPVVNKNGTVVFVAMSFPLIFYLYSSRVMSKTLLITCVFVIMLNIILIFSRSGLIGCLWGGLLYFFRFSFKDIMIVIAIASLCVLFVFFGAEQKIEQRLHNTYDTATYLYEGEEITSDMQDFNRLNLIYCSFNIIENNFLFGTGLGLENYRKAFHKVTNYGIDSKAHNFYLSYFAELGLVGFSILMVLLAYVFRSLAPMKSECRAFRVSFWVVALMMTMNEYILVPEVWFYFGMLVGISSFYKNTKKSVAVWD